MVICNQIVHTASLGDSRAILGTVGHLPPLVPYISCIDSEMVTQLKGKRPCKMYSDVFAHQITKDQRPDDHEEYQRILESGGRVKRLIDDQGNRIGPYRVWEANSSTPGLTMTRSIGDAVAKTIGVIAKPVITKHNIDPSQDLFVVVASDGIWNCMDNEDVVNFVEYYRSLTCREIKKHKDSEISARNSCIAQLLCEEARARWLSIVEEDDVMIDDISCVVLELPDSGHRPKPVRLEKEEQTAMVKVEARKEAKKETDGNDFIRAPSKETKIRDPRRGSIMAGKC